MQPSAVWVRGLNYFDDLARMAPKLAEHQLLDIELDVPDVVARIAASEAERFDSVGTRL